MNTLIVVLVAASLVVNVITLVVVLSRKGGSVGAARANEQLASVVQAAASASAQGIVFCRSCGSQYDSTLKECPTCKTAR